MIDKIVIFVIRTIVCIVIFVAVSALGGCGTFGANGAYGPVYRPNSSIYQQAVPLPSVMGPTSLRLVNEESQYHGRCWLNGIEVPTGMPPATVLTTRGFQPAMLLPHGGSTIVHNVWSGEHTLRCQLYVLMMVPGRGAWFEVSHEMLDNQFDPAQQMGRTYYLNTIHMERTNKRYADM